MGLIKKSWRLISLLSAVVCVVTACTVSYKFNGSSINYEKVKTISFENFPNRSAAFVWGPMESMFNTALQDEYMQQTRLRQVRQGVTWSWQEKSPIMMLITKGLARMVILRWLSFA